MPIVPARFAGRKEVRCMADAGSILVTGAAGQVGSVGRNVTGLLLDRGFPVRAMVRREDERAASLRAAGAQVVLGDLLEPVDVYRAVSGCRRVYFGMSVSAGYLEAAVAREAGVNALVNMSQMTVSEMSIQNTTPSHQQRQHWLSEQALAWSGVPVVTIRPTMFLESFLQLAAPSVRNRDRIELPFGRGKTSPVAAADVAEVVAAVLADPVPHLGLIYELTGPQQDMDGVAREFSDALNREITYSDISPEEWEQTLRKQSMPEHLTGHLLAMGELHRAGRYDRQADGVQRMTGRRAMSVREFVSLNAEAFGGRRS
jgi:NAD(P)H dehydrogenase (quinone)